MSATHVSVYQQEFTMNEEFFTIAGLQASVSRAIRGTVVAFAAIGGAAWFFSPALFSAWLGIALWLAIVAATALIAWGYTHAEAWVCSLFQSEPVITLNVTA